jgi:hypothetical protein
MKIWKEGYQVVIVPNGATKEEFITSLHTRMEFSIDNAIVYIRDIAFSARYDSVGLDKPNQETFSCLVSELRNQAGVLVGNYTQVKAYLLTFIGS